MIEEGRSLWFEASVSKIYKRDAGPGTGTGPKCDPLSFT